MASSLVRIYLHPVIVMRSTSLSGICNNCLTRRLSSYFKPLTVTYFDKEDYLRVSLRIKRATMTKYARYADLMKQTTEYAKRMTRLSNRIFGEVVRPTNQKSMKVVRLFSEEPVNLRKDIHAYYPRHPETGLLMRKLRYYGLYRDEHEDFKDEMKRMRILRGKMPHVWKTKKEREAEQKSG